MSKNEIKRIRKREWIREWNRERYREGTGEWKMNVEKKERRGKWYRKEVPLYRSIWETQVEILNKTHGACNVGKKKIFSEGKIN